MNDIPEWAKNAATELAHSNWRVSSDLIPIIARALVKAKEQGIAEERERCDEAIHYAIIEAQERS